jgi:hypothetical protein
VFTLCAVLALSFVLLIVGTSAWLADEDERSNAVKLADLKGAVTLDAGTDTYEVTNDSNQPALVRVIITPVVTKGGVLLSRDAVTYTLAADWESANNNDGWAYYTGAVLDAGDSIALFSAAPAVASGLNYVFSEAEITLEIRAEFVAATKWSAPGETYAYRLAWFSGQQPWIDATLASLVDASY